MAGWGVYVSFGFPIPLVMLTLLTLPLPRPIERPFLGFTRALLQVKILGSLPLIVFMIALTGWAFAANVRATLAPFDTTGLSTNEKTAALAKKWRTERNFWISLMSFVLWILLQRVYALRCELDAAKAKKEGEGAASSPGAAGAGVGDKKKE